MQQMSADLTRRFLYSTVATNATLVGLVFAAIKLA
jgi:hypothetical protein